MSAFEQLISGTQQVQYQSQGALSMYYSEGRNFETSAFIVSLVLSAQLTLVRVQWINGSHQA